jgi:oligopeptide/dipeptide ABC transporter ATP-binding protein
MSAVVVPLVQGRSLSREFTSQRSMFSKRRVMKAVDDVSLDIPAGRITGVVGESGCGKSTLARLMLWLLPPTGGSVTFDGVDLGDQPQAELRRMRRRMQMVFQDPYSSLDPRYSVADALLEPYSIQNVPLSNAERRERVSELLSMVGLSASVAANYPHQLSGGQKQRVGIARALALQPQFLVLDEPTASLDVSIQAQIIELLESFRRDLGLTYLFISHDLGLVRYFCDQVVVMYLGRIVEILPTSRATPRHPYTQALLGSTFAPDPSQRRTVTPLVGEIPSPFDLPPGCAFAARCPKVKRTCLERRPDLVSSDAAGSVACFYPD